MENKQNLTIEFLEKTWKPEYWHGISDPTNLPNQKLGYYAYQLQEFISKKDALTVSGILENKFVLISDVLEKKVYSLTELKITDKLVEVNIPQQNLDFYNDPKNAKQVQSNKEGMEFHGQNFDEFMENLKKSAKESNEIFHDIKLSFRVDGSLITLTNGFLLKCLKEAQIVSFDLIENYNAVVIREKLNGLKLVSFVRFEKK